MTDSTKLAAELETPLPYDPEIIGQLSAISDAQYETMSQSDAAQHLKTAKGSLIKAFRMARDQHLSRVDAMKLNYEISEASFNLYGGRLSSMHEWLAAAKGNAASLNFVLGDGDLKGEIFPHFNLDEYSGERISLLLLARLVDIQRYVDGETGKKTVSALQQLITKKHGVYCAKENNDPILSEDDLFDLFKKAEQVIPDSKLDRTLMNFLYPNTSLTEEQIEFLDRVEEEEVRVANGTSHWIKKDDTPAP